MATIITRQTGGTAKGSPLTNAELDNNFININNGLATVEKTEISLNTTAVNGGRYRFTAACTLTLPAAPSAGWKVDVENNTDLTSGITVARNGSLIESIAEDMTVDLPRCSFQLVYATTEGWKLYEST
jgi:hypothetical protein